MRTALTIAALLIGGCDGFGNGGTGQDGTIDPFVDPPVYDPTCDGFEGTPVAGAMGWFEGSFQFFGNDVEGTEVWALMANDTWIAGGEGSDCALVWRMAGIKEDPHNCASCDYALVLDATPDPDLSDCHDRFYQAEGLPFSVTYNVRVLQDGTAEFLYADSGNLLGAGEGSSGGVTYASDPRCFFF